MMRSLKNPLDLNSLLAYAASLNHLTLEEIRKAKVLYLKNAIKNYKKKCCNAILFLILVSMICMWIFFGCVLVLPLFALLPLYVLFSTFFSVKSSLKTDKQRVIHALELWKEDIGNNYIKLTKEL